MISDIPLVRKLKPISGEVVSEAGGGPHWLWWIVGFLIFWPSLAVMLVYHVLNKKYEVVLEDECGHTLYTGYVNGNVKQYLESTGVL